MYKRQVLFNAPLGGYPAGAEAGITVGGDADFICRDDPRAGKADPGRPVSYTHLDVYKRQVL